MSSISHVSGPLCWLLMAIVSADSSSGDAQSSSFEIDPNGYIFFCLCMGRFGNQAEHFLGGLAFAKSLNRTLVLPPFRTFRNVPFDDWFKVEPIAEYHRVILADDFMKHIAPLVWPPERRYGFCYVAPNNDQTCEIKIGNPFTNFWDELGVDFSSLVPYRFTYHEPEKWRTELSPEKYPVLALKGAPAAFPMSEPHVSLQAHMHFSDSLQEEADILKRTHFQGQDYVGIHLRNGPDWENTCELVNRTSRLMSSYQCLGFDYSRKLTEDMCLPSVQTVVQLTKAIVEKEGVKYLFVATDKDPLTKHFQKAMPNVQIVHIDPWLPLLDIVLLTDSKHFIGNCVSSFTSFVWRQRFYHNKGPTSHFGMTEA